nr:hypothetical protein [uncultured Pseudomonas sp.]
MTQTVDLSQAVAPVTQDETMAALLGVSGDLDKAQVLYEQLPAWLAKADAEVLHGIGQRDALDDATCKKPIDQISDDRQRAESAELERLTQEALRLDDLGGCALPTAH